MRTFIDIHILQTVPPSNINRDDTGSPKTASYGGVRRARVSSQAWKRATRTAFDDYLDRSELGVRTKQIVGMLAAEIRTQDPSLDDQADELAAETMRAVGIKVEKSDRSQKKSAAPVVEQSSYLVFFSRRQIENLAVAAIDVAGADDLTAALKAAKPKEIADRDHSVDVALFGRMVADQADLNVDAAVQVAHAISVHGVETEFDYYTAVDDLNREEDTGAGMIGTVEFNSSTLYRYAALSVDQLHRNLGDPQATVCAVQAFVEAFVRSMPTGKQNTFANRTLPEAVVVQVRESQPINLVGAFEEPVRELETGGRIKRAAHSLRSHSDEITRCYGESPVATWVTRVGADTSVLSELGTDVPLSDLVTNLGELIDQRLGSS